MWLRGPNRSGPPFETPSSDVDFDMAMEILARSAGDELVAFLGEPRTPVRPEAVLEAGRVVLEDVRQHEPLPPWMEKYPEEEKVG